VQVTLQRNDTVRLVRQKPKVVEAVHNKSTIVPAQCYLLPLPLSINICSDPLSLTT